MSADQNTSPFDRYVPVFANPFSEHNYVDTRPGSPVIFDTDPVLHPETAHTRLDSPASPLVSVSRSVASEDGHDIVPPDQSVNKSYVSLPGNAVAKRPRRRYDEIERIYQCSWSGCTKRYGTLNHLNAHIVMRRHGNERTPDGEIHGSFYEHGDCNRLIVGHLRQNSRSLGNSRARLRKMNRNAWRGLNGLMLCAQSQLFSIPRNLMSGSPSPCLMGRDTIFTILESPLLRWTTSLPVAKRRRDIRSAQRVP